MRYLGMDVHGKSTVWCLVDERGEVVREGRIPTTAPALTALMRELAAEGEVLAGQEVGTLTYLVHDAVTAAGTTILSFNAHQLRMIAASRKKTDRRDAYWIAKALQSGMYPHPVYVPTGEIRAIRERFGLTQADLARLLHLGANTVSRWESGRNVQTAAMDLLLRLVRDVPGGIDYLREHMVGRGAGYAT